MHQEYSVTIADTSCLILLDKIGELHMLKRVFGTVQVTEEIAKEFNKPLPSWINIVAVTNKQYVQLIQLEVDLGEASAIAYAVESNIILLILDDWRARRLASKLNLKFTGTLGILLKAKELKLIERISPTLDKIQKTNFRFSDKVLKEILTLAGEN
ncbi:MAG: DUF3368 domain-containing protein [Cyclobacteriaceae bacterium]|nr:DUF3368 domain-containing protein [Cyclobacteriaceae bacterium]